MEQTALPMEGEAAEVVEARRATRKAERAAAAQKAKPRLVTADRSQVELRPLDLDALIPSTHRARAVWAFVERLDLSKFYEPIKARGSLAGRSATDPKVLMALWLYAISQGIGSARVLEQLCDEHDAYRWLRGGVPVNYHTLSDFRTENEAALDDLFTQILAVMTQQGLITLRRVAQDGMRIRTSAGASSFRRRERLEELLAAAREQVEAVKKQAREEIDTQRSARKRAAEERAVRERKERLEKALEELKRIDAQKAQMKGGHKPKGDPRASMTDPEARKMKMADGGFRPAYNAQLATDTESRVIVGAAITEDGTDYAHCAPMMEQIGQRTGSKPKEVLVDGGFTSKESVDAVAEAGVALYGPAPKRKWKEDAYTINSGDSEAVRAWKERMTTPEGQELYKQRGATAETVNGDLRTWRGLSRFLVRGKSKVRCVLLWSVLAYDMMRYFALVVNRTS
jgi:transposase